MSGNGIRKSRIGEVYGFWTVIGDWPQSIKYAAFMCKCVCGVERYVYLSGLRNGRSKSCGCQAGRMRGEKRTKHGMATTPTYKSWHAMHSRASGKGGHESYPARGITVCDQWRDFEAFFADMGERPAGKTLDRIDNSLGYSPKNCRWATAKQQSRNRDCNRIVTVLGVDMTITCACEKYGINVNTVRGRLRYGMKIMEALTKPVQQKGKKNEH